MFIDYVLQQLKYSISNANFTVKEGGNIMGKRNEGPPRPLIYSKLRFGVVTFHIHPAANQILHHPPLDILVQELCL